MITVLRYFETPNGLKLFKAKAEGENIVPNGCYYDVGERGKQLKIRLQQDIFPLLNYLELRINKEFNLNEKALQISAKIENEYEEICGSHICGIELEVNDFHADHVKPHSAGGVHEENNYLASCATCNKLRWHYSPEEIQVVLKLGVWAKTKVLDESTMGVEIANQFVKHEMSLRKKRKESGNKKEL